MIVTNLGGKGAPGTPWIGKCSHPSLSKLLDPDKYKTSSVTNYSSDTVYDAANWQTQSCHIVDCGDKSRLIYSHKHLHCVLNTVLTYIRVSLKFQGKQLLQKAKQEYPVQSTVWSVWKGRSITLTLWGLSQKSNTEHLSVALKI